MAEGKAAAPHLYDEVKPVNKCMNWHTKGDTAHHSKISVPDNQCILYDPSSGRTEIQTPSLLIES